MDKKSLQCSQKMQFVLSRINEVKICLPPTPPEVGARAQPLVRVVDNIFI